MTISITNLKDNTDYSPLPGVIKETPPMETETKDESQSMSFGTPRKEEL